MKLNLTNESFQLKFFYYSRLVSNLFELLVYSSKLGRFDQWFDCFTMLFGVSPSILKEEYDNLNAMVQIEIEEDEFLMDSTYHNSLVSVFPANYTWVKELIATNSRKGNYYKEISKVE